MNETPQTVRIFISSPGDVSEERDGARQVVEGLRRLYPGADLETVLWEELALPATASFQETIDFLLERAPIDIAVFILWSRLGSPLGAAVTRADGTPYRSGTEREFDLMLTAFERSGRSKPVILAYMREDDAAFREMLTACPDNKLEELIQQRRLAESFVQEQFHDAEGRNLRAYQTYSEPIGFTQRLRGHLRRALDDLLEVEQSVTWTEDPYRGLEAFDIQHAPIFFGRDEESCEVLQRLRDQEKAGGAFVVIVAASGSGKSSLARAGVAANLIQQGGEDGTRWQVSSMIPTLREGSLCDGLVHSLADTLPDLINSAEAAERIGKGLTENASLTVELMIGPAFASAETPVRLLIILDQMEELWTDRDTTDEDRHHFLAAVSALAESGHVSFLATLRSDFYPHAQRSPIFLKLKGERGHFDLLPPDGASIHRLITEPARLAGLSFERNETSGKSLDEVIWEDVSSEADALPLLEYTLSELYQQRDQDRRLMTFAAYVELGGVDGAIGKRADETFGNLPADAQAALDEILPLLVSVDVSGEQSAVRRRATVSDLTSTPARKTLTERLIADRFLTTDREGETPVASLAHEALLRSWDRIISWINSNREHLRLRARVEQQQQRWEQQNRNESLLLAEGLPLDEGSELLAQASCLLADSTADYIRSSISHHHQRAQRTGRLKRAVAAVVVALLAVIIVGTFVTRRQRQKDVTESLVTAVTTARGVAFPPTVDDLDVMPRQMVLDSLAARFESAKENEKLPLAFALARYGDIRLDYLVAQIREANPNEFENFVVALRGNEKEALTAIGEAVAELDESLSAHRLKARLAMLRLYLGDLSLAADMCSQRPDPIQRTVFIDECSSWIGDLTWLKQWIVKVEDSPLRSALCLVVGSVSPDRVTSDQRREWQSLLSDWYQTQPDSATHSASAWALRQWGLPEPEAGDDDHQKQWQINEVGLTMLRIPAGRVLQVKVTQDFLLSAREVSAGQFQQFVDDVMKDPDYPAAEKPKDWEGIDKFISPTDEHPTHNVSWYDAVKFCNWLSRKEGRRVYYKRVIDRAKDPEQFDENQLEGVEERIAAIPGDTDEERQLQVQKCVLLFQLGRYEESLAGFNALHKSGVDDANVHRYRAVLLARSGDTDAAQESLKLFVTAQRGPYAAPAVRSYFSVIVESWLGNGQSALERLKEDLEDHRYDGHFLYNAACACSLGSIAAAHRNNRELQTELKSTSLSLLKEALDKGQDRDQLFTDPALDPLRQDATFVGLYPATSDDDENWWTDFGSDGYRLPSEKEWEYACRAGTTTGFSFGEDAKWLDGYGIYRAALPEACGSKLPNAWGLFDMHGNVYEWCNDVYDAEGRYDAGGGVRVYRGGTWLRAAWECRSSYSVWNDPQTASAYLGFRLATVAPSQGPEAAEPASVDDGAGR